MISFLLSSCKETNSETLFSLIENTNIDFNNSLKESKDFNVFNYRNFYNGGGVAIGDINNDGLPDIFFTGNQVSNRLYLNQGNLKFSDISDKAGFREKKQWSTGVTFVDINNDGWLDIYVCNAGNMFDSSLRKNQLFINNHNLTFTESAHQYGLDNSGYSTQASFFDYDMDGDLDCFIVNNSPIPANTLNYANMRDLPANQWAVADFLKGGGDHLYRNDNGKFIEVTKEAGIHGGLISLGLGVTIGDVNGDSYPDVYVSNDFFERDYLYINQKNGTFKDELEGYVGHTSLASMGADMQDINNDGYPDIFTTDMLPWDDYRLRTTSSFDNYDTYHLKEQSGFYHQFMQNTIQLNNGNGKFMEIANYSGVEASDWSWGALMFDADNDGYNDLYVCNGIAHDLTNQDFIDFFASDIVQKMTATGKKDDVDAILNKMPSTPLKNKAFRNNGNLKFTDIGDEWGFTKPSFSNGAAYGDLDNDGDLDLVINNVNGPAFIYKNNSREKNKSNYIGFSLKGSNKNLFAIGTKIEIFSGKDIFTREQIPSKGFQSSMDYKLIVGLGKLAKIDSVKVIWPGKIISTFNGLALNKVHKISQPPAGLLFNSLENSFPPLFNQVNTNFDKHEEDDYIDFNSERNIPMMLSKEGPRAAIGDVNGDGLEDVYICGSNNKGGQLYLQSANGKFIKKSEDAFNKTADHEQVTCLFFDCDSDGDLDLFVGSGGNNATPRSSRLSNLLFKNDGHGNFSISDDAFPPNSSNIGAVAAYDFNGDGYQDLFVGGRSTPYLYGTSPFSYLYINDGKGHFKDIAAEKNKDIYRIGMVTGAAWADMMGHGKKELIITGEWMAPKIFSFSGDHFNEVKTNLNNLSGWWQTLTIADLDGDGRNDIVLGNIGQNCYLRPDSANPVKLWVNYFGMNGIPQEVITRTINGKNVPVFMKKNLEEQFPYLKKQNLRHEIFATKSIEELFEPDLIKSSIVKDFNYCSSVIAWNEGNGKFSLQQLPAEVQFSSANAIACTDINNDGKSDLIIGGNQFDFAPQFGRLDANLGIVILNKGHRMFNVLNQKQSGIQISGQVRDIKVMNIGNNKSIFFLRNQDYPVLYEFDKSVRKK
ncbi:MAG: hypothetical protein JWN76_780 [Chitinophagaceae bacterium]|nr:hypothetical protein [Chitinophagaceae bacterium]